MLFVAFIFVLTYNISHSQKHSPCPDVLNYEPRNSINKWNAVINLNSRESLKGLWLTITLDRPAEQLGNIFGDAETTNQRDFLIKSSSYILEAGTITPVRFFVKYNPNAVIPSVKEINLNGRTICLGVENPNTDRNSERPYRTSTRRPSTHRNSTESRPSISRPLNYDSVPNKQFLENGNRPSNTNNRSPTSNQNDLRQPTYEMENSDNSQLSLGVYNWGVAQPNRPVTNTRPSGNNLEVERPIRPSNINIDNLSFNNNNRPSTSDNFGEANPNSNTRAPSFIENSEINRPDNLEPEITNYRPQTSSNSNRNQQNLNVGNSNTPTYENDSSSDAQENDDFFAGDFSAIVSRPPSNPTTKPSVHSNQRCGVVASQPRPLISYGQETEPGQWPWHAALYHSKGIQLMYTCGGTLISTSHIVTAAHCVTKPRTNRPINPQNILAYLGKHNLRKFGSEIQDREVVDIYIHPQYNHSGYYNDIAILRLGEPIEITNFVRPVCLWDKRTDLNEVEGKLGTVVGWGFNENGVLTTTLMQAQMPIVSLAKCIYSNRDFFSQFTSEKSFCAGFRNGTSVCNGDSGGGMVFLKRGTSSSDTEWQIRGLVSVGVAFQGKIVCDTSQYVVFTDVAKHLDWIHRVLNNFP